MFTACVLRHILTVLVPLRDSGVMVSRHLGIDVGTESVRVALFDDQGTMLASSRQMLITQFPEPGRAEQDANQWWIQAKKAIAAVLRAANVDRVDSVVVATTSSSVVCVDTKGNPLSAAILWMDQRASSESRATQGLAHESLRYSGGENSPEWLVPKAMWLAKNRPALFQAAASILEAHDFIVLKLLGRSVGSQLIATCKWNYCDGQLPADLYEELGVPELIAKLPAEIYAVGEPIGYMKSDVVDELGLRGSPLVCVGGIDAHLSLVALSELSAQPVSLVAGTSNAITMEVDQPCFSPQFWGPYPYALSPDKWLIEAGQVTAGSVLTWVGERLLGRSRSQMQDLVTEASGIPAVTHGVLALDAFMGNRTPLRDPLLRGAFLGVTLHTGGAEIYRAAVESVAYGTRSIFDALESSGLSLADVYVSGGISHNPLWMRTMVNCLGRSVHLVRDDNLTLRSCALLGMKAVADEGAKTSSFPQFAPSFETVDPDLEENVVLMEGYGLYQQAIDATRDVSHQLAVLTAKKMADPYCAEKETRGMSGAHA